ncbi:FAD-dependent thymidylate synthase [Aneurinibacillus aneurinilyticus]|uniref:FAD-dependent thymidylate synthase n=1 Tax=Aneurinibacillus aneurinilyticus TaxID=1391 RepID=UPI00366CD831
MGQQVTVKCLICGKEEQKYPSAAKRYKTCSLECRGKLSSKTLTTSVEKTCEHCGQNFKVKPSHYESSRYVDLIKHGLTIVFPDDVVTEEERREFIVHDVRHDFQRYVDALERGAKKQAARRRIGTYQAVESVFAINLRSLWHMARQRSAELSPNGREAEPQISSVMTAAVYEVEQYLPQFYRCLIEQIGKGYR